VKTPPGRARALVSHDLFFVLCFSPPLFLPPPSFSSRLPRRGERRRSFHEVWWPISTAPGCATMKGSIRRRWVDINPGQARRLFAGALKTGFFEGRGHHCSGDTMRWRKETNPSRVAEGGHRRPRRAGRSQWESRLTTFPLPQGWDGNFSEAKGFEPLNGGIKTRCLTTWRRLIRCRE
jgi:hypothetical protein